jgi:hypothetical protein
MMPETAPSGGNRHSLSHLVQDYIKTATSDLSEHDRRKRPRLAIPYIFKLTPIDDNDDLVEEQSTSVVGRDLSLNGISFSFDEEPKFKRALISLDHPAVGRFAVVARLLWSKRTLVGLFETGCQLLCIVDGHIVHGDGDQI